MKKLAGVPLKDLLDIVPSWCTHITVNVNDPDGCLFESNEYFQAVLDGKLVQNGKCEQSFLGDMCEYAKSVEHYKQVLKDDENEC